MVVRWIQGCDLEGLAQVGKAQSHRPGTRHEPRAHRSVIQILRERVLDQNGIRIEFEAPNPTVQLVDEVSAATLILNQRGPSQADNPAQTVDVRRPGYG